MDTFFKFKPKQSIEKPKSNKCKVFDQAKSIWQLPFLQIENWLQFSTCLNPAMDFATIIYITNFQLSSNEQKSFELECLQIRTMSRLQIACSRVLYFRFFGFDLFQMQKFYNFPHKILTHPSIILLKKNPLMIIAYMLKKSGFWMSSVTT